MYHLYVTQGWVVLFDLGFFHFWFYQVLSGVTWKESNSIGNIKALWELVCQAPITAQSHFNLMMLNSYF